MTDHEATCTCGQQFVFACDRVQPEPDEALVHVVCNNCSGKGWTKQGFLVIDNDWYRNNSLSFESAKIKRASDIKTRWVSVMVPCDYCNASGKQERAVAN